jgi:hypothetical protein
LSSSERNYSVHDRDLLAIIRALKEWRHFLLGAPHPTIISTDHRNLLFFKTARPLTSRHARWLEFIQEFDIFLYYVPGVDNVAADSLSRRDTSQESSTNENSHLQILPDHL